MDKLCFAPSGPVSEHILPYRQVRRGDIIVFRYPVDIKQDYVKRAIGLPGDRIRVVNKQLMLNGHLPQEPYVQHVSAAPSLQGMRQIPGDSLKERFLSALVSTGCFRLGEFTLKSGKKSPFYIDLRRLVSDPAALALSAQAYARAAEGVAYDRIAGIPAAGLPLATAASLHLGRPMVWPRMPVKEHGSGNLIEGDYKPGERLLLLDDLITTGASKLEAAEILRGQGLVVEDLVVLIERGRQGRRDMDAAGIGLRAFAHVRELFALCEGMGLIGSARRRELEDYADAE